MMEEIHNFVFQLINNAFDMAAAESEDKLEKDRGVSNSDQSHNRAKTGQEESKVNSSNSLTETTSKQTSKVTVEDLG